MKSSNSFPKVCAICSRPHILYHHQYVVSEDGTEMWAKECEGQPRLVREFVDNKVMVGE